MSRESFPPTSDGRWALGVKRYRALQVETLLMFTKLFTFSWITETTCSRGPVSIRRPKVFSDKHYSFDGNRYILLGCAIGPTSALQIDRGIHEACGAFCHVFGHVTHATVT